MHFHSKRVTPKLANFRKLRKMWNFEKGMQNLDDLEYNLNIEFRGISVFQKIFRRHFMYSYSFSFYFLNFNNFFLHPIHFDGLSRQSFQI